MSGRALYRPGVDEQNNLRRALYPAQRTLQRLAVGKASPADQARFEEVLRVARVLLREVTNPEHYGDNRPGLFTYEGKRLPEIDRFSCADLLSYGMTGPGGRAEFLRLVGLPEATSQLVLELGAVMALIDEAVTAFDSGLLILGSHLAAQAAEWARDAEHAEVAPLLEVGKKFTAGRKRGAVGPVRRAIRSVLKRRPGARASEVWDALAASPPRGLTVCDNRVGRYIETGPGTDSTSYERFANIVSEEKKATTRRRLTE